ncbi:glycosyltransferase [Vibrio sp. WXL210]|uniref:glycosyltransferase n=1 Tax=Vibrio sp. WXL210 TaxID=3450709 RepID=UPI003EC7EDCC
MKKKNRHVIIVGGFKLPNMNASAHRAIENARLLKSIQLEPIIMGKMPDNEENAIFEGIPCFSIDGCNENVKFNLDIGAIVNFVKRIGSENVHSIIAYNYPPIALAKLIYFCRKSNIAINLDLTEWYGWDGSGFVRDSIRYFATELRMRILATKVDKIICTSTYLTDFYRKKSTFLLPFSTDKSRKIWDVYQTKTLDKCVTFLYAGSPGIGMKKDHVDLVLRSFEKLHDEEDRLSFKFNILGLTEKQYLDVFPEHSNTLSKLRGKIEFFGRVSHQSALDALREANYTVLVRPNNRVSKAGFSTKIVESIACSTPVITNDVGDVGLYIKHRENGHLIKGESVDAISCAFKATILTDETTYFKMVDNCNDRNPFSIEGYTDRFRDFYL